MPITIKHIDGHVLATVDYDNRGLIGLEGADLRGADLRGVTLAHERAPIGCHVNERGDYCRGMVGWRLAGADLSGAELRDADLSLVPFAGANLRDARLDGARLNWCQHVLLAEILRQAAATDPQRLEAAETVLAHQDWSRAQFFKFNGPHQAWCLEVLPPFVRAGDVGVPPPLAGPRPTAVQGLVGIATS
jgi:uncharacterized protein YjbI with pentapeptide repeats